MPGLPQLPSKILSKNKNKTPKLRNTGVMRYKLIVNVTKWLRKLKWVYSVSIILSVLAHVLSPLLSGLQHGETS